MASGNLSYLHTPETKPRVYTTVCESLENAVKHFPDVEFLVHRRPNGWRDSITYAEFRNKSRKFGKYLVSIGVQKGDKIALLGPNSIRWAIGSCGIAYAGAVSVNLSMVTKDGSDIINIMRAGNCKGIIYDDSDKDILQSIINEWLDDKICQFAVYMGNLTSAVQTLVDILDAPELEDVALPDVYPEDPATVFTTSGSTGKPKLVLHTHNNIRLVAGDGKSPDLNKTTIMFNDRPFPWAGGSPLSFVTLNKYTRVFRETNVAKSKNEVKELWTILEEEKCNSACLLPYIMEDMLAAKHEEQSFKLDYVICGGQMVDTKFFKFIGTHFSAMIISYGSTETMTGTFQPIYLPEHKISVTYGDVGKPLEGCEIRVTDDVDNIVPLGTVGHIQSKSPCVMLEYIGDEKRTKDSFTANNWFRMGDLGRITDDGTLVVIGRDKDIISRGTRKIYPSHIEDVILKLPGLKSVVVIAVPDKYFGEEVCACFTVDDGVELHEVDVKQHCENKFLSGEQATDGIGEMPKYFVKFTSFNTVENGKVDKIKIKRKAISQLNL